MLDLTYQVSLCRHADKDQVVSDADLLSLRSLLGRRVDGPPAGLSCWHTETSFIHTCKQVYCPTLSCDFRQSWLLFLVEATRGKEHKNRVSSILVDSFKRFRSSYVKKQHSYSISPMAIDSMPRLGRPEMASLEDLNSIKNSRKQSSELCSVPVSQTVPIESSCSPTSNDSLSVRDLDVFKQVRNWWVKN